MTKPFRLTTLLLVISVFIFTSCNQDPASVPDKLIPDEDKVEFNKFDTYELNVKQSSSYYEELENLYGADTRILGKNDYAKSSILFSWDFYLPDSIKTYINNGQITILSSEVSMTRKYKLGDTTGFFDFTVHKIISEWDVAKLHRDTLQYINRDANDIASNKIKTDSTVTFDINKNVVYDWLRYTADSNSTDKNNGIYITPTNSTNYFVGFEATYAYGTYEQTQIMIVLQKPTEIDTLVGYPSRDLHVVEKLQPKPVSEDRIYLEGGYALRGTVFFDLSSLPKEIAISKATIELTIDTQSSVDGIPASDSLFVHILKDSTKKTLADSSSILLLTRKGNKFTGDISGIVQAWNSELLIDGKKLENQGINLTLFDEYSSVARIVLYGSKEQNALLRPRLTIYYPKKI